MAAQPITDIEPLERCALTLPDEARAVTITSQATYDRAVEMLRGAVALADEISAHYRPLKEKAYQAHRAICEAEKKLLAPPTEAASILKRSIAAWDQEQERLRREAEARLAAEERRRAEGQQLAAAAEAEALGATQEDVDAILSEPVPVVAVQAAPRYQRAQGVVARTIYSARVVNLKALLRAVLDGTVPEQAIMANQTFLNAQARALKEAMQYPGVQLLREGTTTVRR
jgi:hypothetical protein